jgi:hypothetical protein
MLKSGGFREHAVNETGRMAEQIREALPRIKGGTLRIWGVWFGRPYDNLHSLVRCESKEDKLRMHFNEDETLDVWVPSGLVLENSMLRIGEAERVRWEWFSYGRPKVAANRFFKEFVRSGEIVTASTDVDRFMPEVKTDRSLPAVEMLRIG